LVHTKGNDSDEFKNSTIPPIAFVDNRGNKKGVISFGIGLVEDFDDRTFESTGTRTGTWGSTTAGRCTMEDEHGRDSMTLPLGDMTTRARQADDELESRRER
jgi:hypothetical protein